MRVTVVEFEPLDVETTDKLIIDLYNSDGGEDLRRTFALSGEVRVPGYALQPRFLVH